MDYEKWCARSEDELCQIDLAEINLTAASGLPGAESLDIGALRKKLDDCAGLVDSTIRRLWHKCGKREYRSYTPNQFRILAMVTVLQRDLGVRYNPACMTGEYDARDARNCFIHGPLTGHGGTCASLPFLYVSIGRRLGFPLFVVQAKEHLFARWDGEGERFNIEATQLGFEPYDDLHFLTRPRPLSAGELRANPQFLRNMTPREELACCIAERAAVLFDNLKMSKAVKAIFFANYLSPFYFGRWAVISTASQTVLRMQNFDRNLPWERLVSVAAPRPQTRVGRWAVEQAKKELIRHVAIRRTPKPELNDSFFNSLNQEPPHI